MKKIVFYIGSLSRGGAQRVIVTLANSLSKRGFSCVVATSYKGENEYSLDENIKRIVLVEKKQNFIKKNLSEILFFRKLVKEEKPDTVLSFMGEPNTRMLLATFLLKCRKVVSVRNDPCKEYNGFLYSLFVKVLFNLASHVVFQTENAKNWFPKSIRRKSSVVMNPVDDVFFETEYNGIRKDIVTVGRLVPQKNHELLIRAFARVAANIEDNLVIYGDGELRNHLIDLVKSLGLANRVLFPGLISNVAETIKSAKLFVLSSNYEGMPNALMEAMALGIPCISTDCPCGGPKSLLEKKYLFSVNDAVALVNLLCGANSISAFDRSSLPFNTEFVISCWIQLL